MDLLKKPKRNLETKMKRNLCTLESLNKILTNIKPYQSSNGQQISCFSLDDYNEVFPNILIGNHLIAKNKKELCKLNISHVLNCAEPLSSQPFPGVETSQEYYNDLGISYMGLQIDDTWNFPILSMFDIGTKFVHLALQSNGKILVNCIMGMSRSTTIVLAYLMKYQGMPLDQALITIRKKREVHPNIGFLQQLIEYNSHLKINS